MRLKKTFAGPVTVQIYVNGRDIPLPPTAVQRDRRWYEMTFDSFSEFLNMVDATKNYAVLHIVEGEVQVYVGQDDF